MKVTLLASGLGFISGAWNLLAWLGSCHSLCTGPLPSAPGGDLGLLTLGFSILLVLSSLSAVVIGRYGFYAVALFAASIDVVEAVGSSGVATGPLLLTFLLATLALVLSVLATRTGTGVSEQSHPMNLPVFG